MKCKEIDRLKNEEIKKETYLVGDFLEKNRKSEGGIFKFCKATMHQCLILKHI